MWKLKIKHLFGGYGLHVLLASLISMIAGSILSIWLGSVAAGIICMMTGMILPFIAVYLYQNYRTDVMNRIRSAEEPDWRELQPYEYEELLEQKAEQPKKFSSLRLFALLQIVAVVFLAPMLGAVSGVIGFVIAEAVIVLICLVITAISRLSAGRWENIDASARIAEITADDTYNVIYHGKRHIYHRTFYVYYLSSGRYVADESQLYSGSTVKIVRWNGSYIYLTRNK